MAAAATTRFTGAFLHLDSLAFHLQRGAPHSSADVMEGHTERRVPPRLRRDFAFDRRVVGIVDCRLCDDDVMQYADKKIVYAFKNLYTIENESTLFMPP
jgi:hypothetical protein